MKSRIQFRAMLAGHPEEDDLNMAVAGHLNAIMDLLAIADRYPEQPDGCISLCTFVDVVEPDAGNTHRAGWVWQDFGDEDLGTNSGRCGEHEMLTPWPDDRIVDTHAVLAALGDTLGVWQEMVVDGEPRVMTVAEANKLLSALRHQPSPPA